MPWEPCLQCVLHTPGDQWPVAGDTVTQHMGPGCWEVTRDNVTVTLWHYEPCTRHILVCSSWVVLVYVCPSDVIIVHCQLFDGEQNDDTSLIWAPQHWAATAQFLPEPHTPSTLGSISSTASCNPTQNIAKVYLNQRENHQSKDGVDIF